MNHSVVAGAVVSCEVVGATAREEWLRLLRIGFSTVKYVVCAP